MRDRYARYVFFLFGSLTAVLLPVFILNLTLLNHMLGSAESALLASRWQETTHGVTYAPTLSDTHLFKTLRLNDRLPELDTVVFGSSTAMGITENMFPQRRLYNYAQSGNSLTAMVAEAEYLEQHAPQIRHMVIPLDWSPGFIYQSDLRPPLDLSVETAMQQAHSPAPTAPLLNRMRDALSYPRVATLFEIFQNIIRAEHPGTAFRGYFLQAGSDDYRCTDGSAAKDFDTVHRGTCTGFRYDGSATFANSRPVQNPTPLILSATVAGSKYRENLLQTKGEPNRRILQRLAELHHRLHAKGGGLIVFMPPLLPGMEAEFDKYPPLATALQQTKQTVRDWANAEGLSLLDAGRSENFGCQAKEFIDEHHALPACYSRVFAAFRTAPASKLQYAP